MESIILSDDLVPVSNSIVTVGMFDGMHLGHRVIMEYLMARSEEKQGVSTVLTFDPHPRVIVQNRRVPLLTSVQERATICRKWGVDRFIVIPFTQAFSKISAEKFITDILLDRIGMQEIVVGHDHSFGWGGRGNESLLRSLAPKLGFTVDTIPARIVANSAVSSSRIRTLIEIDGAMRDANKLLGYEYGIDARVVHGSARGQEIGFPTANLLPVHPQQILPANGVYAVRVFLDSETGSRSGMMNIGIRPTFGESDRTLEVHILDFDDNLYGQQLRVEFVEKLREERQFEGIESLVRQLKADRERCIESLSNAHVRVASAKKHKRRTRSI